MSLNTNTMHSFMQSWQNRCLSCLFASFIALLMNHDSKGVASTEEVTGWQPYFNGTRGLMSYPSSTKVHTVDEPKRLLGLIALCKHCTAWVFFRPRFPQVGWSAVLLLLSGTESKQPNLLPAMQQPPGRKLLFFFFVQSRSPIASALVFTDYVCTSTCNGEEKTMKYCAPL